MQRFLSVLGFRGHVIDNTEILDTYRGTEIKCWLEAQRSKLKKYKNSSWYDHDEIESFIILDDDSDMEDLGAYLIKTDNKFSLTEVEANKALKMLNG